jgi:hypothetical protein
MEESMSNERPTKARWRERLQMAAQIAALISCIWGMTIAYFAYQNWQRAQGPASQGTVTPRPGGAAG